MRKLSQTAIELLIVAGAALLFTLLAYSAVRTQVIESGASNIEQKAATASAQIASITPSPRVGNVSVPPAVSPPGDCSECGQNSTCPSGYTLERACAPECVYGECGNCDAECTPPPGACSEPSCLIAITGCATISENGTYMLGNDITASGDCIVVTADNASLNCNGRTINSSAKSGSAVLVSGASNFAIGNCTISGFAKGVYFDSAANSTLTNSTFSDQTHAIYAQDAANMTVFNNTAVNSTTAGVYALTSSYANITQNNLSSPGTYGIYLLGTTSSNVSGNNITAAGYALYIASSGDYNTAAGNSIRSSTVNGAYVLDANGNRLEYNNVTNSTGYGIRLEGGAGNSISSNNISVAGSAGIYLNGTTLASIAYNTVNVTGFTYAVRLNDKVTGAVITSNTLNYGVVSSCAVYYCGISLCAASCPASSGTCTATISSNAPNKCSITIGGAE
ncbi:MAG: NosD domain-containing protein [Candidatus Micrarchaeota archaeon]